ncbi:hornerin-like [Aricia agestis]|uniref:hornerin-like n=1 Tax=Aricia agestis TaxID=91739 RepID=UPI001C2097B2|nr:hornerin-like [Aricia agestis]
MVLRNCLVLALVALSQVSGTPSGYGVKGGAGAVAKAEASASAGAFGGLPPIPVPSGAGFSGSYSKSSASSFASSSASASSSSFSFTGSGANAVNGFGLNGGCSTGSCGCSTGACQNNGGNDIKTSNGEQGNYGTAAQSTANSNGNDCSFGQCGITPSLGCSGADCSTYDNKGIPSNDCKSGNCGQTGSSNDIYVNVPGRSTKNPEEPYNYGTSGNGQNIPTNGKPSTLEPECNSYDCISPSKNPATDDEKRPSSYDVPIFGTTIPSYFPDSKEPCTSPDCQGNDSLNGNPIKPGYNSNLPVTSSTQECAGGICTSQTAAPSTNNLSQKPLTSSYNVPSSCTGPNCGTSNSVNVPSNLPSYNTPGNCGSLGCGNAAQPEATSFNFPQSYEHSGKSSTPSQDYFSSVGFPKCDGPNCGTSDYPSTNSNTKQPSTFKYPGNCGSLGCGLTLQSGSTNNENQASSKGFVDNSFTSEYHQGCNGIGCSTPSLGNNGAFTKQPYYSRPGDCGPSGCGNLPNNGASYSYNQPNYQNSGNSLDNTKCQGSYCGKPSYTNVGTSNVPNPNCGPSGCIPQGTGNTPSYIQPGYGGVISPSTTGQGSSSPSQSWSTQSTVPPSSGGYNNPYSGTSFKPTSPIASPNTELVPPNKDSGVNPNESSFDNKQDNPVYTGGYGSSTYINQNGVTKPHESAASPSPFGSSKPSYFPSTPQYSHNTNIPSKPVNGYDLKPFGSPKPDNNKQVYTGGFGAPKGPIDQSIPAKPKVTTTVAPSTQANIRPSNTPTESPYNPTHSGSYNPIPSSPAPQAGVPQSTGSKDSKKGVPYTGGFGGPTGFLNPNDYSIPAKLPTPSTGPSIAQPIGYNAPTKPSTPNTGPSAAPCTSNNCGSKSSYATSLSSASHSGVGNVHAQAAASAAAYTGGFGGPPGFLKPFDDGKVPSAVDINGVLTSLQEGNGNLGYSNTNNKNAANGVHENGSGNTGAVAQANAVATSSAGAYGLGAGPSGGGAKGCSLGCGATTGNGADGFDAHNHGINAGAVASAKSVAGAGSYGAGGSFTGSSASAHASAGAATKGGTALPVCTRRGGVGTPPLIAPSPEMVVMRLMFLRIATPPEEDGLNKPPVWDLCSAKGANTPKKRGLPCSTSHLDVAPIVRAASTGGRWASHSTTNYLIPTILGYENLQGSPSGVNKGGIKAKTRRNGAQLSFCYSEMHTPIVFLCCVVGYVAAHNVRREAPYPPSYSNGYNYEPSQRLFWGNGGSNQVGGTGLWATLTNKFPFLNNMFGKIEVEPAYRSLDVTQQYFPNGYQYQSQYTQPQYIQPQYIQPQYIQPPNGRNVPFARDVGLTDDAVIITPPDVPLVDQPQRPQFPTRPQVPSGPQFPSGPQNPTRPQIPSVPQYPVAQPAPEPVSGYSYDKPLYRLELPHK